jgi:hypothetical protein
MDIESVTAFPFDHPAVTITVLFVGIFLISGAFGLWRMFHTERKGVTGTAVVKGIKQTSRMKNNVPQIVMTLDVTLPGYPPYTIEKYVFLPPLYYPRVQPGMTVQVVADPKRLDNDKYLGLQFKDTV